MKLGAELKFCVVCVQSTVQEEDFNVHLHSKRASPQLLEDTPLEPMVSPAENGLRQRRKGSEGEEEVADPVTNDLTEPDPVSADPDKREATGNDEEEDEEWSRLQKKLKDKSPTLDTPSGESHVVHCPYFPLVSTPLPTANTV